MYEYALVGYFNKEFEDAFKDGWKNLKEMNISDYGFEREGKRPHITLADYGEIHKSSFIERLERFYHDKYAVDLNMNVLGSFMGRGTLFLAPTTSKELQEFHLNHHREFDSFSSNVESFYLPGRWVPHCTIASRLEDSKMIEAYSYCRENFSFKDVTLSSIGLIELEIEDGAIISEEVIFEIDLKR